MATVNVTFTTKKLTVPATVNPQIIAMKLLKNGVTQAGFNVPANATGGSFPDVPDGTYTTSAQALSNQGEPMGTPSESDPFTVVNTHEVDVPDVVTVTVG